MTYIEKTGSLFDSTADAYAHGVNTEGLMGAGIAVLFKKAYPEMYTAYKALCKLGSLEPGEVWIWDTQPQFASLGCVRTPQQIRKREAEIAALKRPLWVYNIASQDQPGPNARLEWFERGLIRTLKHAQDNNVVTLAMPRIGCGIGGLDWEDVRDIVEHYAERSTTDIEVWSL